MGTLLPCCFKIDVRTVGSLHSRRLLPGVGSSSPLLPSLTFMPSSLSLTATTLFLSGASGLLRLLSAVGFGLGQTDPVSVPIEGQTGEGGSAELPSGVALDCAFRRDCLYRLSCRSIFNERPRVAFKVCRASFVLVRSSTFYSKSRFFLA